MNTADAGEQLESMLKRHDDEIGALAAKVRDELVVPACRKHRLRFSSGNGTFFFSQLKGSKNFETYGDRKDLESDKFLSTAAKATIGPILDLLNQEIAHAAYLGYWVEDVNWGK